MTLRNSLGAHARRVYERLDQVVDSDDGIIVLVDSAWKATSYLQGFALSGCQFEGLSLEIERAIRAVARGRRFHEGESSRPTARVSTRRKSSAGTPNGLDALLARTVASSRTRHQPSEESQISQSFADQRRRGVVPYVSFQIEQRVSF